MIRNDAVVIQLTSELEENDIPGSESGYHRKYYSNYTHPKTLANIERRKEQKQAEKTRDDGSEVPSTSNDRRSSVRKKTGMQVWKDN